MHNAKWYDKFKKREYEKPHAIKKQANNSEYKKRTDSIKPVALAPVRENHLLKVFSKHSLFDNNTVPHDAMSVIENFDDIIKNVIRLSKRQILHLPDEIRELSHELTDERGERRVGYMNEPSFLSAYVFYFSWWNLARLVRLFSNMKMQDAIPGDVCIDIGSGPLTVPIALWLAYPELRKRKLVWYCIDISEKALALGEELYLSVAARTLSYGTHDEAWRIIKVKGAIGVPIRQKGALITCANVFNEILQRTDMTAEYAAKTYCAQLIKYGAKDNSFFIAEPGTPQSARFISLMRDELIKNGCNILSPCTHTGMCPMPGKTFKNKSSKWCNIAFATENAPERLLNLSKAAGIPKVRAVISFVMALKKESAILSAFYKTAALEMRIISDKIHLPGEKTGFYACKEGSLVLIVDSNHNHFRSGDYIAIEHTPPWETLPIDTKTGAAIIEV